MTRDTDAIETRELTKRFGTEIAVDGLNLTVDHGTVYGFLGPNGAGKTTTMRMLTSLTRPTDGEAWINGNPVSDRDAIRASIGYLPEEPPVLTNSPAANSSSTLVDFVISLPPRWRPGLQTGWIGSISATTPTSGLTTTRRACAKGWADSGAVTRSRRRVP